MKRNTNLALAALLAGVLALTGCGSASPATQSLAYADDLKKAVGNFEESRTETAKAISETTEQVVKELEAQPTPNLTKAADEWASAWSDVNERIAQLTSDFGTIAKSSEEYFKELEKHAEAVRNPTLKQAELEKYRAARANWNKEYAAAAENIGKLRNVEADGEDFQHILIGAALRDRIQHNIEDLREISKQANNVLTELARLTAEGQKLVNEAK
jgi:hypothetical protein